MPAGSPIVTAVFGGSFNPPHVGHVLAAAYALSSAAVAEVFVVPVYVHPFAKELAPFEERLTMCELAVGWLPGVTCSSIERDLGGESRTLRTIEALVERHPDRAFRLVIGADVVADLPKWHRFDRIEELAPPIILGRSGFDEPRALEPKLPDVSSTDVRERLRNRDYDGLRGRVPARVVEHINKRGLYVG